MRNCKTCKTHPITTISGINFCKHCFSHTIIKRIHKKLNTQKLKKNEKILIHTPSTPSGMMLLDFFTQLQNKFPITLTAHPTGTHAKNYCKKNHIKTTPTKLNQKQLLTWTKENNIHHIFPAINLDENLNNFLTTLFKSTKPNFTPYTTIHTKNNITIHAILTNNTNKTLKLYLDTKKIPYTQKKKIPYEKDLHEFINKLEQLSPSIKYTAAKTVTLD